MLQNRPLLQFGRACFSCFFHLKSIVFLALTLTFFLNTTNSYSAQVTLGWSPNAENDLAGYKIYYGTSSGMYDSHVDVGDQTNYTLSGLASGETYFLASTAYNLSGNESAFSEEVNIHFNTPPVLSPIGDKSVSEGKPLNITISATDPDGDALDYTLSNLPTGASFDNNTGDFSWRPSYSQAGKYPITFEVRDGQGTDSENITITVVNTNRPPELSPIAPITVHEGDTVTLNPSATDLDGDSLTFTYSGWMASNRYTTNNDDAGEHRVTVTVDDGELTVFQEVIVTVVNTNRPPELSPIAPIVVNEGATITLDPRATDLDGDFLTFTYSGWISSNRYTTNYDDAGEHRVTVTVDDGELTVFQEVIVTVVNTNRPPELSPIAPIVVHEGDTITLDPTATDPDEDSLTFTFSGWMSSNRYTTNYNDAGEHRVTVTVDDGELTDFQEVIVTVVENTPIGYWEFNEGSGTIAGDSSGSGNDGTIYGDAAWSTGRGGSGLSFDGSDDFVDVGDIDLTEAFTISAWINISSMNTNTIVGKSYSTYQFFVNQNGRLIFQRNSGKSIDFNAELEIETWYHVATTFDTAHGMVMYLNGSIVDTDSDTSVTGVNNVSTKIGAAGWLAKNFFHGTIDEVRLYTRALSAQEVQKLYNQFAITVPFVYSEISVDGNLNESHWDIVNEVNNVVLGTTENKPKFGVLWDDIYLYVGVEVLDGDLYNDSDPAKPPKDDSIAIYIDGDHNHGTVYDMYDRGYIKGWNNDKLKERNGYTSGVLHGWASIPDGYSIELAIPWSNLGISPKKGTTIGFSVGCNDDDNGEERDGQSMWVGTRDNYRNTSSFGDAVLGE